MYLVFLKTIFMKTISSYSLLSKDTEVLIRVFGYFEMSLLFIYWINSPTRISYPGNSFQGKLDLEILVLKVVFFMKLIKFCKNIKK